LYRSTSSSGWSWLSCSSLPKQLIDGRKIEISRQPLHFGFLLNAKEKKLGEKTHAPQKIMKLVKILISWLFWGEKKTNDRSAQI